MADSNQKKRSSAAVSSAKAGSGASGSGRHFGHSSSTGGSHHHSSSHHHHGKSAQDASREKYRKIVSYTFAFILSLFMLLATVCIVALTSLFSESFFCSIISNDYYESVLSEVITEAEDYTIPAEFDVSVLDGVFTQNGVERDVNGHVTAAFRGYTYTPDLQTENNKLYANVAAYIAENGVAVQDDQDAVIAAYAEEIDKIYLEKVKIPGIDLIKAGRKKLKGMVTFALIVFFGLSLVLIAVLLKLYRYPHQGMRYIAYASGGCTLMAFALPFGLYLSKIYARVQVSPEYFYNFVSGYIKQILFSFMLASLLWLIITAACVVFVYMSKNGMLEGERKQKLMRKLGTFVRRR